MGLFTSERGAPRQVLDAARRALADQQRTFTVTVTGPTAPGVAAELNRYISQVEETGWQIDLVAPAGQHRGDPLLMLLFRPDLA